MRWEGRRSAYQSVGFCFLKIIAAIERVEPGVQEELCPFAPPYHKAPLTETLPILRKDQIDLVAFKVCERPNDAVRRDHGFIPQHQRFEALLVHDVRGEGDFWVHDQAVRRQAEEVGRMRVLGHGVP